MHTADPGWLTPDQLKEQLHLPLRRPPLELPSFSSTLRLDAGSLPCPVQEGNQLKTAEGLGFLVL